MDPLYLFPSGVLRLLVAAFFAGLGLSLVSLLLDFYLEALAGQGAPAPQPQVGD